MIKAVSLTRIREYTKEKAAYGDGSTDLVRADDPVSGRGDSNSRTDLDLAGGRSSCIVAVSGPGIIWQLTAFVVVSFILLVFTRPFAKKYINSHHEKTNYEELIGGVVKVTETVDNIAQTGAAFAQGKEWTARAEDDRQRLEAGSLAEVVAVSGVKLILKHYEEV